MTYIKAMKSFLNGEYSLMCIIKAMSFCVPELQTSNRLQELRKDLYTQMIFLKQKVFYKTKQLLPERITWCFIPLIHIVFVLFKSSWENLRSSFCKTMINIIFNVYIWDQLDLLVFPNLSPNVTIPCYFLLEFKLCMRCPTSVTV